MKQAIALQAKKEDRPAEGHFVGNMTLLKEIVEFPESGGAHLPLWVAVKIDEVTPLAARGAAVSDVVMAPDQTDCPDHHHDDTDPDDASRPEP